jgi:hypothetical protein
MGTNAVNFVFCDHSLKFVSTNVDAETLRRLAVRNDGLTANAP